MADMEKQAEKCHNDCIIAGCGEGVGRLPRESTCRFVPLFSLTSTTVRVDCPWNPEFWLELPLDRLKQMIKTQEE